MTRCGVVRDEGFEVCVHDRNFSNREKKVDVHLATMMTADAFRYMQPGRDTAVLAAGDGDFVPTVEVLQDRGIPVWCLFWDHASHELRRTVTQFVSLNPHLAFLALSQAE
jgi:uncharacterized LabA/DUF88 family protein